MSSQISEESIRYYSFARQALVDALLLGGVGSGDHVLIPALICKDVVASIHTVGATPIFYAVNELLAPIKLEADDSVKAIIAVNYFGFPQNLEIFKQECERIGAVLIEDNAHGFLSSDASNLPLGTRGHLGIESIRKSLRISDGAKLYVNDLNLRMRMPEQIPYVHNSLGFRFVAQKWILDASQVLHLPLLEWVRFVVRLFRRIFTGTRLPISPQSAEYEKIVPIGPRDSSMSQIMNLDYLQEMNRRVNLYGVVSALVLDCDVQPIFDSLPPNCVPYGYPFYGDRNAAKNVQASVKKLGVEVINWPDLPESVVATAPAYYQKLWVVNFL